MPHPNEFRDWREQEITQAVMESLKLRIQDLTDILQAEAGKDSLQDRYHAGYIAGLKDLLNISVEGV